MQGPTSPPSTVIQGDFGNNPPLPHTTRGDHCLVPNHDRDREYYQEKADLQEKADVLHADQLNHLLNAGKRTSPLYSRSKGKGVFTGAGATPGGALGTKGSVAVLESSTDVTALAAKFMNDGFAVGNQMYHTRGWGDKRKPDYPGTSRAGDGASGPQYRDWCPQDGGPPKLPSPKGPLRPATGMSAKGGVSPNTRRGLSPKTRRTDFYTSFTRGYTSSVTPLFDTFFPNIARCF